MIGCESWMTCSTRRPFILHPSSFILRSEETQLVRLVGLGSRDLAAAIASNMPYRDPTAKQGLGNEMMPVAAFRVLFATHQRDATFTRDRYEVIDPILVPGTLRNGIVINLFEVVCFACRNASALITCRILRPPTQGVSQEGIVDCGRRQGLDEQLPIELGIVLAIWGTTNVDQRIDLILAQ